MKTALVRRRGVRHAIREGEQMLTLCGMHAYVEPDERTEPSCSWCRDRLNLKPTDSGAGR